MTDYGVYVTTTSILLEVGNILQKHGSLKYTSYEEFILDAAPSSILFGIIFILL